MDIFRLLQHRLSPSIMGCVDQTRILVCLSEIQLLCIEGLLPRAQSVSRSYIGTYSDRSMAIINLLVRL